MTVPLPAPSMPAPLMPGALAGWTLPVLVEGPWGPVVLVLVVILAAQLLEDAAVLYAGWLAATGALPLPVALAAAYVGIVVGDLWLYGAGRAARRAGGGLVRRLGAARVDRVGRLLRGNDLAALCLARAVPFMRLPVYLAAGFLGMPFPRFAVLCALLAVPWTLALTGVGHLAGLALPDLPVAAAVAALALLALPRLVRALREQAP